MDSFLFQAFVYLGAAVIAVPVAIRLGLGSVLGYLIAGVVIGPLIGFIGSDSQNLRHFAEFGVVMMLFVIGLELEPRMLWQMRNRLIGLGGLQVALTAATITAVGIWLGYGWRMSLAAGLILTLSSTAIVLQTLNEKGLLKSDGGQASLSVLLFQDIAVIPMLALIPLLAIPGFADHAANQVAAPGQAAAHASLSLIDGLPGWGVALVTFGSVAVVIFGGHYLSRPLFRFIARADLREMFTATALLLVVAIALLMTLVGLSPALGTFLAGVVLANSEFRHELKSDIEPFKGLLLGLFFITVGAGINFDILVNDTARILAMVIGVIAIKAAVLFVLAKAFKITKPDNLLLTLGLAQAGEFGFVLLGFAGQNNVLDAATQSTLALVVALSMLLTPALFIFYDKVILPNSLKKASREPDVIDETAPVIIAGLGRFGQIVNRMLVAHGIKTVVLDHKLDVVAGLGKFGVKSFYGDATRPDLLHSAGLKDARMLVIAIDDPERATELVRHAKRENPDIHVIARAYDRLHVYRLFGAGADDIVREVFDSAVRASRYALQKLGMSEAKARKATAVFVEHDREAVRHLAQLWREGLDVFENEEYIDAVKTRNKLLAVAMAEMQADQEKN